MQILCLETTCKPVTCCIILSNERHGEKQHINRPGFLTSQGCFPYTPTALRKMTGTGAFGLCSYSVCIASERKAEEQFTWQLNCELDTRQHRNTEKYAQIKKPNNKKKTLSHIQFLNIYLACKEVLYNFVLGVFNIPLGKYISFGSNHIFFCLFFCCTPSEKHSENKLQQHCKFPPSHRPSSLLSKDVCLRLLKRYSKKFLS